MHIVIDARNINSGTGDYMKYLLEYLQKIDTENRYSVLVPSKDLGYWQPTDQNFQLVAADFANYSLAEQIGFKKFLDNLAPDLVHFCMPQQPLRYAGKKVATMHDMTLLNTYNSDKNWLIFHAKQLVGRYVFKKIAKTNDHIIAISENTKREYQEFSHIPDEKISVIYEACAEDVHQKLQPYQLPFEEYILYVGQQPDYKNIPRLAEAHQKLLEKHPTLGLVLVGRDSAAVQKNKELFEKRGYKNILFTGFVSDVERDWIMKNAKAYAFPSLMEGFGLPPLIAMQHGTPVVSSNTSCMPEILGDAARYFDPKNIDAMAAKINEVLTNEPLRQDLIKKGYVQVKKYSWEKTARETHAVYMSILSKR